MRSLPRAFDLSWLGYCLDFVVMPPVMLMLAWFGSSLAPLAAGALFLLGALGWTLAEYGIHRELFHGFAPLRRMHDVHHANPKGWVGVATWGTGAAFTLVWLVVYVLSSAPTASAFTSGLLAAYLFYCGIHLRFHHGDPARFGRYVAFMARLHNGHHRGGRGNFGVSSPIWDFVFRTYRPIFKGAIR